jgi:hypothetical protein
MLFAAVTHLVEGLRFETLLTLKTEKSLFCLVGTWRPAVPVTEQSILFLKRLISIKVLSSGIKLFRMQISQH